MSYTITLMGEYSETEADEVREAFEAVVRAIPGTSGELVLDGVTYPADDVPEVTEPADDEEADEEEEEVAP